MVNAVNAVDAVNAVRVLGLAPRIQKKVETRFGIFVLSFWRFVFGGLFLAVCFWRFVFGVRACVRACVLRNTGGKSRNAFRHF